ncbi:hypothetical protein NMY22_g18867 [Coprinellus aureogranulatus]|nr:hypothetical protein NMY22_g18867 [Coprinellus aureogranulatus]
MLWRPRNRKFLPLPRLPHLPPKDDDLDDFLSDLGIDDDTDRPDAPQTPLSAEPEEEIPELTPEELAERKKQETAAKRADILKRHHEWQQKLDNLVEEQKLKVVEGVEEARKNAVAELVANEGLGKKAMGSVEKQGEKLMKGLQTYLNKAEGRSDKWKSGADDQKRKDTSAKEKEKWQEVLDKVSARFDDAVKGVQGEVHDWYISMRNKEREVATSAAAPIKDLAETAQANLAMDYAWLDDVTYRDWQNYHDLVRTYENFEKEATNGVQQDSMPTLEGTKPSWLTLTTPDPLVAALDNLQRELDDIVAGFGYSLSGLKSRAKSILATSEADAESEGTFAIKRKKGELVDDMRGIPGYEPTGSAPAAETVTILPISPPSGGTGEGSADGDEQKVADAAKIFVGKAKVQVEEAIGRAVGEL